MCKRSNEVLPSVDLVTPGQGQDRWRQYKAQISSAYKHGKYEKKGVEHFACNIQRLSFCHERWLTSQTSTTDYIDQYVTHMD